MYIPSGVCEVKEILSKSSSVTVYYDPDVDGLIAGFMTQSQLAVRGCESNYVINRDRSHGFLLSDAVLENYRGTTFICVDFSISMQQMQHLVDCGISVISIDHHDIKSDTLTRIWDASGDLRGVIVNNQYPFEPAMYRFLSGAGVVYYVLCALFSDVESDRLKSLVGISLLSDIRPIENNIAFSFLKVLYETDDALIKYYLNVSKPQTDYGFGQTIFDRSFIDYEFTPKINALLRYNFMTEAIAVIRGEFSNPDMLDGVRNSQKKLIVSMREHLQGIELSNLVCKCCQLDDIYRGAVVSNFIGLACNAVLKESHKTSFLFINGNSFRGSVRGKQDNVDYLQIFRNHGFICEGHKPAFGVKGFNGTDFTQALSAVNSELESKESESGSFGDQILECRDLKMFMMGTNIGIADYNNYVRDSQRRYIRYRGINYHVVEKKSMNEFIVDGCVVKCFDKNLSLVDGLILPILERGRYVNFYLCSALDCN